MREPSSIWDRIGVCARCEQRCIYSDDGYRGHRGKPCWIHVLSDQPWCPQNKQHGPRTRLIVPVPALLQITELGEWPHGDGTGPENRDG